VKALTRRGASNEEHAMTQKMDAFNISPNARFAMRQFTLAK